jgi:hypothetical protein
LFAVTHDKFTAPPEDNLVGYSPDQPDGRRDDDGDTQ